MASFQNYPDIAIDLREHVATVEIRRAPHNFFDLAVMEQLAHAYGTLDENPECRALVLCSDGKNFSAGNDFGQASTDLSDIPAGPNPMYTLGARLFSNRKPVVGAIQGAAIGGGLGLALTTDFRVATPETRFAANFVLLGFHQGFGLSLTLPRLLGQQQANLMLYTGRRYSGEEALQIGLCEYVVAPEQLRQRAWDLAREMAMAAPLAVQAVRATMRQGLAEDFRRATAHEAEQQRQLRPTEDFKEGVRAVAERRAGNFTGN